MKLYICREYLQIYIEFLQACGADVAGSRWMREAGACLESADELIPFQRVLPLRDEFAAITDAPLFPFHLGEYLADNLGTLLEYSLQSCRDLNEIAELSIRFHSIRSNVIVPRYRLTEQQLEFELECMLDDDRLRLSLLFSTAALTYGFLRRMFGDAHRQHFHLYVDAPEPEGFSAIVEQIPFPVTFGSSRDCIAIDTVLLRLVNPGDDPRLKMLLMQTLMERMQRCDPAAEYRQRVRALLRESAPHYPGMEDTASALHLSKRTLARRLQAENTTYLAILDEVRIEESVRYLEQGLPVSEIASQLGYESAASFINLFKKKTGRTPGEYRRQAR